MLKKLSRKLAISALVASTAVGSHSALFAQEDDNDQKEQKRRVIVIEEDDFDADGENDHRVIVRRGNAPKYWIGVACSLNGDGVTIGEVLPDSPAEEAGLKSGDRVVSVGEEKVSELSDLVEAVQSDGKPINITVQRADAQLEIPVTPAERPKNLEAKANRWNDIHLNEDWEELIPHLRGLMGGEFEDFDISMIQPGVIVDPAELPKGVRISIQREGDGPAKVTIKRGDDSWEVTEDSLDKLPEDLRGPARKMLSAMSGRSILNRPGIEKQFERLLPGMKMRVIPDARIERRIRDASEEDALRSEIEEMRKEIRELRELLKELKKD